ncbi:DNA replication ATP-dependent helicase/nuclease JHS1 [Rosa rugosa]|uniref:DNA replication ATP-dependent helicase/nuclease JHS1 n=1 Tax=Rosa rugosa TaxID=74645 RepID=UPI002B40623A|nr:DNA replication ATP-dependent helicase/nuclease JHS1 [Rosa rugosa]
MAPRKKPNSSSSTTASSRKSNSKAQPQPSKFSIQHFFERHTQNSQNPQTTASSAPHNPKPPIPDSSTAIVPQKSIPEIQNPAPIEANSALVASGNPENRRDSQSSSKNSTQETPTENLVAVRFMDAEPNVDEEASPEVSKSKSVKRFKFSPGMLIKQSQDDGGDEVTWRTSPVNERLKAVSKHKPEMMRVLADSSRLKSLSINQCSQNKTSAVEAGKVEKSLSLGSLNRVGVKRVKPDQDVEHNGNVVDRTISEIAGSQSPFRTPPSLSYCHDKLANALSCDGVSDEPGLRPHKKALLELLDQVEDVIFDEDSVPDDVEASQLQVKDKSEHVVKRVVTAPTEQVTRASSNYSFLVLEVSENCRPDDSSGAQCMYKVLRLLNEQSGEECAVYLREEWFYSVIAPGDTVNVIGEFDDQGQCHVDHHHNFLIVHPDVLVSGTRVAANFICPRRTVLDERLKGNEYSTPALIGTILHQVFEAALMKEKPTITFLEEHARMGLQRNIENLYACGVHENDIYKTLVDAVPKILNWVNVFKNTQDSEASSVDFGSENGVKKVTISEVIDIEEMAWAPKYGLKGMIDASVRVKVEANKNESDMKVMPLEFKTGKVPKDQEHCAQVILYTLLMSERYQKHVDTGLLCYLQSDQTQGIAVRRSDLVGLIMQRNQLANDIVKASRLQVLPPMLRSPSLCRSCRHLNVCTIYHKAHGGNADSSGLGDLFDSNTHQLTTAHGVFLRLWDWLIDLEAKEMELVKKEMWRPHGLKSDHSTSCLSSMVLDNELPYSRSGSDNKFIYRFLRTGLSSLNVRTSNGDFQNAASSPSKFADCTLRCGDHVIISSESGGLAVARGVITDISHSHVSVSFSKKLRLPGGNPSSKASDLRREVWRVDKDEFMTSFATMRFNLLQLFLPSAQTAHLRKMIVDLEAPRFDSGCITFSQDPAISYVWSQRNLNDDQRRAILKILTAKDYALILGMPGTGKTSTMVHAVKALLMRGASILLTSYTNSAVDNLLIKLKAQNIDFVRIGRHEVVHEEVRGHCFSAMNIQSVEDIKSRLDQVKVVAVTCLGITSPLLANKKFDVCIMDEAGQTTLPVSLGPLMFASIFVLVGDHYQLPPLVKSTEARENGMGVSLFCRLSEAHPQAISALQSQYRMCQGIMELSNALIYGDRLRCGSPEIANAKLNFSSSKSHSLWIKEVLNPSKPVIFINTDALPAFEAKDHKIVNNPMEAHIVVEVVEELVNSGIEGDDIGIITPYNSQAEIIRLAINLTSVEIHTIDKYQGRDKDCILVSFVRSTENPRNCTSSLLGDWHRINVALTRAKKKLIMVGSRETLSKVLLMKLLIEKVEEQSGIFNVSKKDINFKRELKRCSQVRSL